MDKNPLLKYMMKDKKEDVVHSSGYAEAQNRGNIGAASAESFAKRQAMEASRTAVQGYRDSKVVYEAYGNTGAEAAAFNAEKEASQRAAVREKFGGERESGTGGEHGGASSREQKTVTGQGGANKPAAPGWREALMDRYAMPTRGGSGADGSAGLTPPARRNPGISR